MWPSPPDPGPLLTSPTCGGEGTEARGHCLHIRGPLITMTLQMTHSPVVTDRLIRANSIRFALSSLADLAFGRQRQTKSLSDVRGSAAMRGSSCLHQIHLRSHPRKSALAGPLLPMTETRSKLTSTKNNCHTFVCQALFQVLSYINIVNLHNSVR